MVDALLTIWLGDQNLPLRVRPVPSAGKGHWRALVSSQRRATRRVGCKGTSAYGYFWVQTGETVITRLTLGQFTALASRTRDLVHIRGSRTRGDRDEMMDSKPDFRTTSP